MFILRDMGFVCSAVCLCCAVFVRVVLCCAGKVRSLRAAAQSSVYSYMPDAVEVFWCVI